ncbi:E3 ubiquitin-protein ligase ATL42-like [Cornus florida]|uniref:E3 ubiquitin-protein ligase ATL42-like n=1 Tax=Cornus florida TaxID=4283 RepID=UPI00289C7C16|nr:E3 ubiquitin-protein ligase ATL42-like [Cornus florida]
MLLVERGGGYGFDVSFGYWNRVMCGGGFGFAEMGGGIGVVVGGFRGGYVGGRRRWWWWLEDNLLPLHIQVQRQWLEKHSSCPLCRVKVSADDLTYFVYSTMELFVQREEDHHGSSRFSIGSSFRKSEKGKKEEEFPIQVDCDSDENEKALHKFNHRIIMSDVVLKNRWSSVSSSDLMRLNSEILNAMSSNRFSSLDVNNDQSATPSGVEDTEILKIKEEMERERVFESRVNKINQTDSDLPNTLESKIYQSQTSRFLNPNTHRSMSDITVHPRFTELGMRNSNRDTSLPENNVKEERLRRLWLPIARRTVQWFANREERTQQSRNTRHSMCNFVLCISSLFQTHHILITFP